MRDYRRLKYRIECIARKEVRITVRKLSNKTKFVQNITIKVYCKDKIIKMRYYSNEILQ